MVIDQRDVNTNEVRLMTEKELEAFILNVTAKQELTPQEAEFAAAAKAKESKEDTIQVVRAIMAESKKREEEAKLEGDPTDAEDNEKIKALEAQNAELKATMEALGKPVDPKIAAEMAEEPKPHKFKSTAHFLHDVIGAGASGRDESSELTEWRNYYTDKAGDPTQMIDSAEGGGYLLPPEQANEIFMRQTEVSSFMANALKMQMTGMTLKIPVMMGFDESSKTYYGNVAWKWSGELQTYVATDIEFEMVELHLEKLTGMVYLTDEILKFARPAIKPYVDRAFDVGMNRALTGAFIRGTGAGMPQGVLGADCTLEISEETNQVDDTFVLNNMLKMQARLYSTDENPTGIWYSNRQLIPQLATMVLTGGTASTPMFMVRAQDPLQYSLMGLPLKFSTTMSAIGDSGDIMLVDPSQYFIGMPASGQAIEQASSIHVQFIYGQTAFRFTTWIAGQPGWRTYFTPEYGDTMSPFIKLEAR